MGAPEDCCFHLGPLDQGWWPDGLLTPPSDEAMRYDLEFLKEAGAKVRGFALNGVGCF